MLSSSIVALLQRGVKFIVSLLDFRFKPDYDSAAPMLERAAVTRVCVMPVFCVGVSSVVRIGPKVIYKVHVLCIHL